MDVQEAQEGQPGRHVPPRAPSAPSLFYVTSAPFCVLLHVS